MSEIIVVRDCYGENKGNILGILICKNYDGCVVGHIMEAARTEKGKDWTISDSIAALEKSGAQFNWYPSFGYLDI